MKKILAGLLCVFMVFSLAGCSGKSDEADTGNTTGNDSGAAGDQTADTTSAGGEKKVIKIAWTDDTMDQTRAVMLDAAKARVKEINEERSDIELQLTYYDAQASVDKQISDVETALLDKPDVVIFSSVDTVGSLPAVQQIKDSGAKILDIRDIGRSDLVDCVFYGSDEATYAAATTQWLKNYLNANPDVVLKVGLIYGAAAQTQQFARCDLVKTLAEEMPDRVQVIDEKYGNWDTQTAMNITEDWMQSHPDMNYICCANDIMALGASNALVAAKKKADVLVTGVDVTDEGVQRIKDGQMDCTVGAQLKDYGQMIDVSLGLAEGTYTDPTYTVKTVYAVDQSNVDSFLAGTLEPFKAQAE
jgi:ABC-type sugar transport system substrate-binding protein